MPKSYWLKAKRKNKQEKNSWTLIQWTTYGTITSCAVWLMNLTRNLFWFQCEFCSVFRWPHYLGYLNQKYEMDFRCSSAVLTAIASTPEHKIRKLSETSASEAENYLRYQTVGTGWLHYILYHTDSNAWFILFFVIYSSQARNSYSLELL